MKLDEKERRDAKAVLRRIAELERDVAGVSGGSTDLTYTAATRVLASSTGTDATLPLMSSGDAGLVPASGGGTTNYLRADGTWEAPTGGLTQSQVLARTSLGV
jgi:hypothetical protein